MSNEAPPHRRDKSGKRYVNPFSLLQIELADLEGDDFKKFQRAKKRVAQEIDLEDGRIAWIPNLVLDRSAAIDIADELMDETLREWHWRVCADHSLGSLLFAAKLSFFQEKDFLEKIKFWKADAGFKSWISSNIAKDLAADFAAAVENVNAAQIDLANRALELIADGHREVFLDPARRKLQEKLAPIENLRLTALKEKRKVGEDEVSSVLESSGARVIGQIHSFVFQEEIDQAASSIRMIAIEINNEHGDIKLACKVAGWSAEIAVNSQQELALAKDAIATLKKMHDTLVQGGYRWRHNGEIYVIDGYGAKKGGVVIKIDELDGVCWGYEEARALGRSSLFWMQITGGGKKIEFSWRGKEVAAMTELAEKAIAALKEKIVPAVAKRFLAVFSNGAPQTRVGQSWLSQDGATMFHHGWLGGSVKHSCDWLSLTADIVDGELVLGDLSCRRARAEISLSAKNAFALWFFVNKVLWGGHEELRG